VKKKEKNFAICVDGWGGQCDSLGMEAATATETIETNITMIATNKIYYGFSTANSAEQPAWFYTAEAALRFATACGFTTGEEQRPLTIDDIETTSDVDAADIMDTATCPWSAE
jgi:hypothetical protein